MNGRALSGQGNTIDRNFPDYVLGLLNFNNIGYRNSIPNGTPSPQEVANWVIRTCGDKLEKASEKMRNHRYLS
jgi:hypothetical protein